MVASYSSHLLQLSNLHDGQTKLFNVQTNTNNTKKNPIETWANDLNNLPEKKSETYKTMLNLIYNKRYAN